MVIKGDNLATIMYVQEKINSIQWQCIAILDEVKNSVNRLVSFLGFKAVDRKANGAADILAKKERISTINQTWEESAPLYIIPRFTFDYVKAYDANNLNYVDHVLPGTTNLSDSAIVGHTQTKLALNEIESNG